MAKKNRGTTLPPALRATARGAAIAVATTLTSKLVSDFYDFVKGRVQARREQEPECP